MTNHYKYFSHKECEFFPCHKESDGENFNCLFCFCPLYLVKDCGGAFAYTNRGIKDCSHCLFPHKKENYGKIMARLKEEMEMKGGKKSQSAWMKPCTLAFAVMLQHYDAAVKGGRLINQL